MSQEAVWYLGPLGDLRPLPGPEPGIEQDVVRYGGTHQGLSGARTMDVTGHRAEWKFTFTGLDEDLWEWLFALHTRVIPGPHRMLNPLYRNRLSLPATSLTFRGAATAGLTVAPARAKWVADFPTEAGVGTRGAEVSNTSAGVVIQFDAGQRTTVLPGEHLVGTVWVRSTAGSTSMTGLLQFVDQAGAAVSTASTEATVTSEWSRITITTDVPQRAASVVLGIRASSTTTVRVAAPQIEEGEPSRFSPGGGAPIVLLDQMPATSPRYPLQTFTVTILEA